MEAGFAIGLRLAVIRAQMEEAVAALGAARDALANDDPIALEMRHRRLAPRRIGEVDGPRRLSRLDVVAELDIGLEQAVIRGVGVIARPGDDDEPRLAWLLVVQRFP